MSLGQGGELQGARLSVIELRRICPLLLILLVILHAFQSLAGKVFKHNVIIASGDTREGGLSGVQGLQTPPVPQSCPSLPSELNLHRHMLQQLKGPQNSPSLANSLDFQSLINTCPMHPKMSP